MLSKGGSLRQAQAMPQNRTGIRCIAVWRPRGCLRADCLLFALALAELLCNEGQAW